MNQFQVTSDLVNMVYDCMEGDEDLMRYHQEHGTLSMLVLTQYSQPLAHEIARLISQDIEDKIVIEIGAGIGFLAIEIAKLAKQVYAIEVDPAWSWVFTRSLYAHKPPNLTWIFGKAETMLPMLKGDIAVVATHSGINELRELAYKFAPNVIMPLQEFETLRSLTANNK